MLRNLREQNAVLDDVETSEYLQSLGSRIGATAQDGEQQITMFVVRDPTINAFATPGGFIGVNTGLITADQQRVRTGRRGGPRNRPRDAAAHRARRGGPGSQQHHVHCRHARRSADWRDHRQRRCHTRPHRHVAGRGHAAADQLHAHGRTGGRSRGHRLPGGGGLRPQRHGQFLRRHDARTWRGRRLHTRAAAGPPGGHGAHCRGACPSRYVAHLRAPPRLAQLPAGARADPRPAVPSGHGPAPLLRKNAGH